MLPSVVAPVKIRTVERSVLSGEGIHGSADTPVRHHVVSPAMASLYRGFPRVGGAPPRRWIALVSAMLALAVWTLPATADTKSELASARERLADIEQEIEDRRSALSRLEDEANALAGQVEDAEGRLEEIQAQLEGTQASLDRTQARYDVVQGQLNSRARELYMQGPASDLSVILGATSMGDLADRLEYSSLVGQADADLGVEIQRLSDALSAEVEAQKDLLSRQAGVVEDLNEQMDELDAMFDAQQEAVAAIEAKRAEAERIIGGLQKKYREELAAAIAPPTTGGGGGAISGVFQVCPVGQPRAISDGFGAPRYGGGYHLHAGNDIMAPTGTPIYATFAGTATENSNTLGGLAVVVSGSAGYTYNAHLSAFGKLGAVQAGDVIGYVGATGDTSTPHNHFEWHPNVIPSNWPASPYGYAVIDDAVNPYPLLAAVC